MDLPHAWSSNATLREGKVYTRTSNEALGRILLLPGMEVIASALQRIIPRDETISQIA
jgi:hypothetical protein